MSDVENTKDLNNVFLKISNEHQIITEYVSKYENYLKNQYYDRLIKDFKSAEETLVHEVKAHFEFEERNLFPLALKSIPEKINLVLELQKEHGRLEEIISHCYEKLNYHLIVNHRAGITRELFLEFKKVLELFKHHAKKEIEDLFPAMNTSQSCLEYIEKTEQEKNPKPGAKPS